MVGRTLLGFQLFSWGMARPSNFQEGAVAILLR